jgi:hypothetical protein
MEEVLSGLYSIISLDEIPLRRKALGHIKYLQLYGGIV